MRRQPAGAALRKVARPVAASSLGSLHAACLIMPARNAALRAAPSLIPAQLLAIACAPALVTLPACLRHDAARVVFQSLGDRLPWLGDNLQTLFYCRSNEAPASCAIELRKWQACSSCLWVPWCVPRSTTQEPCNLLVFQQVHSHCLALLPVPLPCGKMHSVIPPHQTQSLALFGPKHSGCVRPVLPCACSGALRSRAANYWCGLHAARKSMQPQAGGREKAGLPACLPACLGCICNHAHALRRAAPYFWSPGFFLGSTVWVLLLHSGACPRAGQPALRCPCFCHCMRSWSLGMCFNHVIGP